MGTQTPNSVFHYVVTVGLESAPEQVIGEFREANGLEHPVKLPGVHKLGDVTLKRGVVDSSNLWNWMTQVRSGGPSRRWDAVVTLRNEAGQPVQSWKLNHAKPVRYTGPTLGGTGNDIAIEELILEHESISIVPPR